MSPRYMYDRTSGAAANFKMADVKLTTPEDEDGKAEMPAMPPPSLPIKPKESTKEAKEQDMTANQAKEKNEKVHKLNYKVPTWSGIPEGTYSLEVLKNGCIISNIDLSGKPFHVFGRLPNCDVTLEHPSVSRYHAVLQYKACETASSGKGLYIYDFGSTHGTYVNKTAIESKRYYRVRVGYVIKFGGSSRLHILQGPEEPEEEEEEEMQEKEQQKVSSEVGRVMTEEEYEKWKEEKERPFKQEQEQGISWGMGEDAVEEPMYPNEAGDKVISPDEHNFKDPKKTLRGFSEREGLELEYEVEETGPGHARVYHCRVKLPIETPGGEPLYADASVTGKKREAVLACASEACRMLDAAGLLRQSSHESKKRKVKNWEENDFYDSDEDSFLDRTGSVEKKRQERMKKAGKKVKGKDKAETYESLTSRLQDVENEINSIQSQLEQSSTEGEDVSGDSLETFMNSMGSSLDKSTRLKLKRKMFELKKEKQRLNKLVDIARPVALPSLNNTGDSVKKDQHQSIETPKLPSDVSSSIATEPEIKTRSTKERIADVEIDSSADATTETSVVTEVTPREDHFVVPKPMKFKEPKPRKSKEATNKVDHRTDRAEEDKKVDERASEKDSDRKRGKSPEEQQVIEELKSPQEVKEPKKKKKKNVYRAPTEWEAISDPTYSAWTPPVDQTGDGRTSLNDKFGY